MMTLKQRVDATDRVIARFRSAPFSWKDRRTCLHLARAQMRALGHRPPAIPDLRSALTAQRVLKARGFDDLAAVIDSLGLPRVAPLAMWPGDLALVPGEGGIDALGVSAGGTLLMYHADADGLVAVKEAVGAVTAAWRL